MKDLRREKLYDVNIERQISAPLVTELPLEDLAFAIF